MEPHEMFDLATRKSLTMWAMLNGIWKCVTDVTGDWVTFDDSVLPSEFGTGKTRCLPLSRFTEFDFTT